MWVFYGDDGGAPFSRFQSFGQLPVLVDESGDFFGESLAAGDFNDDGFDDLAIGTPGRSEEAPGVFPEFPGTGFVHVRHGTSAGLDLSAQGAYAFDVRPAAERCAGMGFGWALAAADLDGDGHDDLAIGAPHCKDGRVNRVYLRRGDSWGLRDSRPNWFRWLESATPRPGDQFGAALAACDLTHADDGEADLVIGNPALQVPGGVGQVAVAALPGLVTRRLAIGAPGEDLPSSANERQADTGAVYLTQRRGRFDTPFNGVYESFDPAHPNDPQNYVLRMFMTQDESNDLWVTLVPVEGVLELEAWHCVDDPRPRCWLASPPCERLPHDDDPPDDPDGPGVQRFEPGETMAAEVPFELESRDDPNFEGGFDIYYPVTAPGGGTADATAGVSVLGQGQPPMVDDRWQYVDITITSLHVTVDVGSGAVMEGDCGGYSPEILHFRRVE